MCVCVRVTELGTRGHSDSGRSSSFHARAARAWIPCALLGLWMWRRGCRSLLERRNRTFWTPGWGWAAPMFWVRPLQRPVDAGGGAPRLRPDACTQRCARPAFHVVLGGFLLAFVPQFSPQKIRVMAVASSVVGDIPGAHGSRQRRPRQRGCFSRCKEWRANELPDGGAGGFPGRAAFLPSPPLPGAAPPTCTALAAAEASRGVASRVNQGSAACDPGSKSGCYVVVSGPGFCPQLDQNRTQALLLFAQKSTFQRRGWQKKKFFSGSWQMGRWWTGVP